MTRYYLSVNRSENWYTTRDSNPEPVDSEIGEMIKVDFIARKIVQVA
ncbi:MAG: hypothetical protein LBJ43_03200 [Propionibacteriaceae bacterium]|nr:hypothetical protein [Propionibacteriaceae bacterium]